MTAIVTRDPDTGGHVFWPPTVSDVVMEPSGPDTWYTRTGVRCALCDRPPEFRSVADRMRSTTVCACPDGIVTEILLPVPSGKMIVSDSLRPQYGWDQDDPLLASYNTVLGQHQVILAMAEQGCAFGYVGNTSPDLYLVGNDRYEIAVPECGEDDETVPHPGEKKAQICTDLWAYSCADFEDWKSRGGDPGTLDEYRSVVDVTPGTYRFTYLAGQRGFDPHSSDAVVFARIELING